MDLVYHLHNQDIACVGNVLANRLPNCKMRPDEDIKKNSRATIELYTLDHDDVELRAMRWFNNRSVCLIST